MGNIISTNTRKKSSKKDNQTMIRRIRFHLLFVALNSISSELEFSFCNGSRYGKLKIKNYKTVKYLVHTYLDIITFLAVKLLLCFM